MHLFLPNKKNVAAPHAAAGRELLVSDVDDTLLGDERSLAELVARLAAAGVPLALNSSRPLPSVLHTLANLPVAFRPRGLITAMGTEVTIDGRPDHCWAQRFRGWDRKPLDVLMAGLGALPHRAEFQTDLKASFTLRPALVDTALRQLAALGIPCTVAISGQGDLDLLPPGAGKGPATLHLARRLGVDPAAGLIVAGDSANDLAMFRVAGRGIVVGNARDDLRTRVDPQRCHLARAAHAAGILEGLRHFRILTSRPQP